MKLMPEKDHELNHKQPAAFLMDNSVFEDSETYR